MSRHTDNFCIVENMNNFKRANISYIRYVNPSDIYLENGYSIDVFATSLDSPCSILFTKDGDMLIGCSGQNSGNPSVLKWNNGNFEMIADKFYAPLTGINSKNGDIYVSHKGTITVIKKNGSKTNIVSGLPSFGDYPNSRVSFPSNNKMYFGLGTATNSGIVGNDNSWMAHHPLACDNPGFYVILNGQNFESKNRLIHKENEKIYTGSFSPYGCSNTQFEVRKGMVKASGSILRANLDGSGLELVSWGFRHVAYLKFDANDRLFVSNNGYDNRGSRPISNASDEFFYVPTDENIWYGWPDYSAGEPVTLAKFKPEGGKQPQFLLSTHPNIPPKPFAIFPANSNIMGFDFNYDNSFGNLNDIYIAEYGNLKFNDVHNNIPYYPDSGFKVSKINGNTGHTCTFAINKSGLPASISNTGGFGRLTDIAFGPDKAMYILDMGICNLNHPNCIIPNTGVIWKVTK